MIPHLFLILELGEISTSPEPLHEVIQVLTAPGAWSHAERGDRVPLSK